MNILLLSLANISVIALISLILKITGLDHSMARAGISYFGLLLFSCVLGFGGAILSLFMSKTSAKQIRGMHLLDAPTSETEAWLLRTVQRQAQILQIKMPEVGIFETTEPNAFATGPSKNNAMVAVSTGLLRNMQRNEIEAVLGHEMTHIANGDMVTMTLLQGVLNTFVIFLSRAIAIMLATQRNHQGEQQQNTGVYFFISMILQMILGVGATLIAMWFSRYREFRADEGGAKLSSTHHMISALSRLRLVHSPQELPDEIKAFSFIGGKLDHLFASHPPLETRIAALVKFAS